MDAIPEVMIQMANCFEHLLSDILEDPFKPCPPLVALHHGPPLHASPTSSFLSSLVAYLLLTLTLRAIP